MTLKFDPSAASGTLLWIAIAAIALCVLLWLSRSGSIFSRDLQATRGLRSYEIRSFCSVWLVRAAFVALAAIGGCLAFAHHAAADPKADALIELAGTAMMYCFIFAGTSVLVVAAIAFGANVLRAKYGENELSMGADDTEDKGDEP